MNKSICQLAQLNPKYGIKNEDYRIIWFDNFDKPFLDETKWEYELGLIRNIEQQHYVDFKENVFIRQKEGGGELVLKATKRPEDLQYINPNSKGTDDERKVIYNSGSIRTHGKMEFLYGRLEICAKLPKGKGVFPAFWTLGSDNTICGKINTNQGYGWARCGEIDIMELIGGDEGSPSNKDVYQTLHLADTSDFSTYKKLAGTRYSIKEDFFDKYHIFGINWSKNKMEWYVDDKIVYSEDYSKDEVSKKALNRPQYIQLNLAMGGIWPGEVSPYLDNKPESEFVIDYVCYAQNEQQKKDAEEYYKNSPKIENAKDLTIKQGETDIISHIKINDGYEVDFSIVDSPQFKIKEEKATSSNPITEITLLHKGKADTFEKLASLPKGEYMLYYSAFPKNMKIDAKGFPDGKEYYKFHRKGVRLNIV